MTKQRFIGDGNGIFFVCLIVGDLNSFEFLSLAIHHLVFASIGACGDGLGDDILFAFLLCKRNFCRLILKAACNLSVKVFTLFDGRCHEVVDILGVRACKVI